MNKTFAALIAIGAFSAPALALAQAAGHPILGARLRYEGVDQANFPRDAQALTLRTTLGWETTSWRGVTGLVEVEDVRALVGRYAVNAPGATTPPLNGAGKARFPVVNDPQGTELNRLQVTWTAGPPLTATLGRQRIAFDDQRFIGAVAWRQDEQTFDAARADIAFGPLKATYAYLDRVNRVLGEARDWRSDSHLVTAALPISPHLRVQAFVYALEFENAAANSSLTRGLKASGQAGIARLSLAYEMTYARQRDWRNAPTRFDLDFWSGALSATNDIYTMRLGYEHLAGNGTRGFTMPLSTAHNFNGWADAFIQPLGANKGFADGLEDLNLSLNVRPRLRLPHLSKIDLILRHHDFKAQQTGARLGREWDLQAQAAVTPHLTAAMKFADFRRAKAVRAGATPAPASRAKLWLTLEYRL
ncbi:alginate export family protein [Phenylobacterium immobile]|uniref:alginate export family protein n=1 Tax=Phenylobacterium immobile TaxID=21 RepID=UPI000ADCAFB7|nr:alginate export family protein [Phenylobacterium immobile]